MRTLLIILMMVGCVTRTLEAHGDIHDTIAALEEELVAQPGSAELLLRIADLHRLHGESDQALRRLAEVDSEDHPEVLLIRGRILDLKGQQKEAVESTRAYTEQRPDTSEGWLQLARLLTASDQIDQAVQAQQRAIKAGATTPYAYLTAAALLEQNRNFDEALRMIDPALLTHPEHLGLAENRARLLFLVGRDDEAVAAWNTLREAHPKVAFRWWIAEGDLTRSSSPSRSMKAYARALQQLQQRFKDREPPPALRTVMTDLAGRIGDEIQKN